MAWPCTSRRILSFNVRFRNLFKGILFFPYLINGVAIGFVFLYFFQPGGTLDSVLALVGHRQSTTSGSAIADIVELVPGRCLGLALPGPELRAVPRGDPVHPGGDLRGRRARRRQPVASVPSIILPGIRPIVSLTVILSISGSLSVFEIPFIMTDGANGTETFVIQTVKLAFDHNKVGLASAAAVVLLGIVLLVTWLQRRIVPDERADLV